jgi:sulfonate transport system substrate-binding protein
MRWCLALLLLVTCGGAAAAPLDIRIAWSTIPAELTPVLFEKKDLLDHLGRSYAVQFVHFGASDTALRALAAGDIDIAAFSPVTFAVAVRNAGMDDLRIVADGYEDGVPRHYASEFLVREDSAIATVEDLAGKVLAVDAAGGLYDLALQAMLRRHGLGRGDYRAVEAPLANLGAMLDRRKIDLAALGAPLSYMVKGHGLARTLFTLRDALGPTPGLMLVARANFLDRNRAALGDFFEDYLRALRWFLDPAKRDEAVLIVAEVSHLPRPLLAQYLFTAGDYLRDRDARPDLGALQKTMGALRDLGFLDIAIDVRHYADLSFIVGAAARLK